MLNFIPLLQVLVFANANADANADAAGDGGVSNVFGMLYGIFLLVVAVAVIFALVDIFRLPRAAWVASGESKLRAVLLSIFLNLVGAGYYWFIMRPKVLDAADQIQKDDN